MWQTLSACAHGFLPCCMHRTCTGRTAPRTYHGGSLFSCVAKPESSQDFQAEHVGLDLADVALPFSAKLQCAEASSHDSFIMLPFIQL